MRQKMLSIGELSAMSGVHINSLRYYDRIGALKPAYVDPQTNYRYYTYLQLGIVEAIQTCIALDIPLKKYLDYTDKGGRIIRSEPLLEYGKAQAEKKIRSIKEGIRLIESLQGEIAHSRLFFNTDAPIVYDATHKRYFTMPMGAELGEEAYVALGHLHAAAVRSGCKTGHETGFLYIYRAKEVERCLCIEIVSAPQKSSHDIVIIPAGRYRARSVTSGTIETAEKVFPDLFEMDYTKYVLEVELLTGEDDTDNPLFELRCSLPNT